MVRDSGDRLQIEITDDGVGFDPDATPHGSGTTNMTERIDTQGGRLTMHSTPGHGTAVTATVPHAMERTTPSRGPGPDARRASPVHR